MLRKEIVLENPLEASRRGLVKRMKDNLQERIGIFKLLAEEERRRTLAFEDNALFRI